MQTYTVQEGDTLYGVSKQFGVSIENLRNENNLTSNVLSPGQVLKIPSSNSTFSYTVKQGDNLYEIAKAYNTTVNEIMRINNLASNALSIGQNLLIPLTNQNTKSTQNEYIIYTIKQGDNLYEIAKAYNTTVDEIMRINNLTSNALSINQQLKIPIQPTLESNINYISYIVRSGDSLYSIAKEFGMTVNELIQLNHLTNTSLSIGQILKVKNMEANPPIEEAVDECYGEGYKEPAYQTYTVKQGDSLYTIAQRFSTTVDQLIALNDLTTNNLSIGQVIKIKEVTQ